MKYAKFSDDFLSYFRLDDNGETLVLTDMRGYTRAVRLLPYEERPQGEWIIIDDTEKFIAKCSVCGRIEDSRMVNDYPYCRCGAKMKGGAVWMK